MVSMGLGTCTFFNWRRKYRCCMDLFVRELVFRRGPLRSEHQGTCTLSTVVLLMQGREWQALVTFSSFVLLTLRDILLSLHQAASCHTSSLKNTTVVSSVNLIIWFMLELEAQSWVSSMESNGLSTQPWGAPVLRVIVLKLFGSSQWGSPESNCKWRCSFQARPAYLSAAERWWCWMLKSMNSILMWVLQCSRWDRGRWNASEIIPSENWFVQYANCIGSRAEGRFFWYGSGLAMCMNWTCLHVHYLSHVWAHMWNMLHVYIFISFQSLLIHQDYGWFGSLAFFIEIPNRHCYSGSQGCTGHLDYREIPGGPWSLWASGLGISFFNYL